LVESILHADERLLRIVNAVFESYADGEAENEEEIVAYTMDGEPLSRKRYVELNDQAEASYHAGHSSSHQQLKEKFQARNRH